MERMVALWFVANTIGRDTGRTSQPTSRHHRAARGVGRWKNQSRGPTERGIWILLFVVARSQHRSLAGTADRPGLLQVRTGARPVVREPDQGFCLGDGHSNSGKRHHGRSPHRKPRSYSIKVTSQTRSLTWVMPIFWPAKTWLQLIFRAFSKSDRSWSHHGRVGKRVGQLLQPPVHVSAPNFWRPCDAVHG